MANPGTIDTMISSIPDQKIQVALKAIFRYFVSNILFGRATGSTQSATSTSVRATNLGGGFIQGTTSAVANREFALPHNLGHPPYLLIPVLPLDQVNAGMVRLVVSRAADASNVYLKSADTSQPFFVYVEG